MIIAVQARQLQPKEKGSSNSEPFLFRCLQYLPAFNQQKIF